MQEITYQIKNDLLAYRFFNPASLQNTGQIFPRPFPHQATGEINLAFVNSTRTILGLNKEELNQHVLIFGRSGAGKTNVVRVSQAELLRTCIPFLSFDLAKYNSRYCREGNYPIIIRWDKEFFFNPFVAPPLTSILEWVMVFCEVTSEAFGLMTASKSLLIDVVKSLYEKFDFEKTRNYPKMQDLQQELEERRKKAKSKYDRIELDYIDRVRNKVTSLLITLGNQLNVKKGIPIDEILNHPVCIELVGINSTEIQTWLVNMIIAWIAAYRKSLAEFNGLTHVIFWDEASKSFSKHKTGNTETFLIHQTRLLRESGEAIVLADQSVASLNDVIKSNIYTFICLCQSGPVDPKEAVAVLGLNPEQTQILNKLEPGQGIIKLAGKYPYPVLVNFPYIEPQYITEKEINEINTNNKILWSILSKIELSAETSVELSPSASTENNNPKKPSISTTNIINKNLRKLLEAIVSTPFDKSTDILKKAGFSGSSGNAIKTFAINKSYVNEHTINLRTRGAVSKYFEISEKGYEFLDEVFIEYQKPKGKGSFEHKLYQNILQRYFHKKGIRVEVESTNGKDDSYSLVDVSVEDAGGRRTAYEIEFNINQHIIQNILKCLEANFSEVIIVTRKDLNEKILHLLETNLDNKLKARVQVKIINEFVMNTDSQPILF